RNQQVVCVKPLQRRGRIHLSAAVLMGLVQEAPARRQNLLTSALAFDDASKNQRSDALSDESPPGIVILEPLRPAVVQALQGALDACLHLRRSPGNLRS